MSLTNTKLKILVVDDEEINRIIINDCLETGPYELDFAEDGVIAWDKLQADPSSYDVILLDRMMPNMDGMEVLAKVKSHPILKDCTVILQSAKSAAADILEGIQAGAYYYLTKPYDEDLLVSVVETAVRDRISYKTVSSKLDETNEQFSSSFKFLCSASYSVQTMNEAKMMALVLSHVAENPSSIILGLSELLINAVEHGNLGISYDDKSHLNNQNTWAEEVERLTYLPENIDKRVEINLTKSNDEVSIIIKDCGQGFDWQDYQEFSAKRAMDNHGRGIALANNMSFKSVEYLGKGNQVKIVI